MVDQKAQRETKMEEEEALERIKNYKIPCGCVLGHGERCQEGYLCGRCEDVFALQGGGKEEEKVPTVDDIRVEQFKKRAREKAKDTQPREIIFMGMSDYPPIGHEFELAYTTVDGREMKRIIRLAYVNEGKGRMSFEFVRS